MKNYGVLKGRAKNFVRDNDDSPHSEVLIEAAGTKYRIAINVRSSRGPEYKRLVECLLLDHVEHPLLDHAKTLSEGVTNLKTNKQHLHGLDYVRSNLFRATDMKPIVHTQPGEDNDLFERIESIVSKAIKSPKAMVYAYGESWGPEPGKKDQYFGFLPGNGIHKIHMNQGDASTKNAKFQDGALFVDFGTGQVAALFVKFQTQVWHTTEEDGSPLPDAPAVDPVTIPPTGPIPEWDVVADDSPYHLARIVGAMVNPPGDDEGNETVVVFNTSSKRLNVKGWKILDAYDRAEPLSGTIQPGHAKTFKLSGKASFPNTGGTITLLDANGLKVDGVAYSKRQAKAHGGFVTF